MKKLCMILPLALILCFMVGCQDKAAMAELEAMKAQAEVEEQNKELVQRIVSVANENKGLDIFSEVCATDYKFYNPSNATPINLEEHLELGKAFFIPFPDLFHKIEGIYADGDIVVARLSVSGTHKGEFQGIPPTGKKIEWSAIEIFRFSNGKLSELWVDMDSLGMMQQLGMELMPKEGEK